MHILDRNPTVSALRQQFLATTLVKEPVVIKIVIFSKELNFCLIFRVFQLFQGREYTTVNILLPESCSNKFQRC